MWKFQGQGSNPRHPCFLCHSCSKAGSLTHHITMELSVIPIFEMPSNCKNLTYKFFPTTLGVSISASYPWEPEAQGSEGHPAREHQGPGSHLPLRTAPPPPAKCFLCRHEGLLPDMQASAEAESVRLFFSGTGPVGPAHAANQLLD